MELEVRKKYYLNGQLKTEYSYLKETDLRHGVQKMYFDNGDLKCTCFCRNNNLHRIWNNLISNPTGYTRFLRQFKDGENHGLKIIIKYY